MYFVEIIIKYEELARVLFFFLQCKKMTNIWSFPLNIDFSISEKMRMFQNIMHLSVEFFCRLFYCFINCFNFFL